MSIRSLEVWDFLEVEILIRNTILEVNSKDYSPSIIEKFITIDPFKPRNTYHEREYFVYEDSTIKWIIGIKNNEIKTFFVDVKSRGKWIWKELLDYANEIIIHHGNVKSHVYSSISARSFYENAGYTMIREDISDMDGEPFRRYYLEKNIINNRWSFWWEKKLANKLFNLVISGVKTATTGLYLESEKFGKVDEYAIIYDELSWKELCLIQYTKVTIQPFIDVDFEYIKKEWEWDKNLESWRRSHRDFFQREYPDQFSDNSLVVCEEFVLIKNLNT